MNKTTAWVLIIAAFLVGGAVGFLAMRQRAIDTMEKYKLDAQKMVDEAKMTAEKAQQEVMMEEEKTEVIVMVNDPKNGTYATSTTGMTLYVYDQDDEGKSNCTGQCAVNWPPYKVEGAVPTNLQDNVSTITRADGTIQYTWNSMPLYYYVKDKAKGDVTGDGVNNVWHLAK
jgi:predicted lipoprotein with Yx(FWY)xxD motif